MKVRVGDVNLVCERAGAGEPVILVMGLGTTRIGWSMQVEGLSKHHDVVAFDNRGAGESDVPDAYWSMADMAADTIGIADHFGFERFHLVGVSMGGMISQQVAATCPQRVRSLSLISTYVAGVGRPQIEMSVIEDLFLKPKTPQERIEAGVRIVFSDKFRAEHPEMVAAAAAFAAEHPASPKGFFSQLGASAQWQADETRRDVLGDFKMPVLIMHGASDRLSPVRNAEMLAAAIPQARLRIWPDAGHALVQECASQVNAELLNHFASV